MIRDMNTKMVCLRLCLQLGIFGLWVSIAYVEESYLALRWILILGTVFLLGNKKDLLGLLEQIQDSIYNKLMVPFSTNLYGHYLSSLPVDSLVLDIGMGNAKALLNNRELISKQRVRFIGCDINPPTVQIAKENIRRAQMQGHIQIRLQDVFLYENSDKFDSVLFSDCWALIPNIKDMVCHVQKYLKPGGTIVILTTLEEQKSSFREFVKPRIVDVLGRMNDFGRNTSIQEMEEFLGQKFLDYKMEIALVHDIALWGESKAYSVTIQC